MKSLVLLFSAIGIYFAITTLLFDEVIGEPVVEKKEVSAPINNGSKNRTKRFIPIIRIAVMSFLAAIYVAEAYYDLAQIEKEEKELNEKW